jgi:hypothetical protein
MSNYKLQFIVTAFKRRVSDASLCFLHMFHDGLNISSKVQVNKVITYRASNLLI